jgi:hypothetical protein
MDDPHQNVMEDTEPSAYKIPIIIKNGKMGKKTVIDYALKGAFIITQTTFFIACGAIAIALESLGKLLKTFYESPAHRPIVQTQKALIKKIKVPILPIDHYNNLGEDEILRQLKVLPKDQLKILKSFEAENQNRRVIIETLKLLIEENNACG